MPAETLYSTLFDVDGRLRNGFGRARESLHGGE